MRKKSIGYTIFKVFVVIFMLLVSVAFLFPYLNIIAKALNDSTDTSLGGITIFPRKFTLVNIQQVLSDTAIVRSSIISVLRVIIGTVIAIVILFFAAYALTKPGLRGRSAIVVFLSIPMFISGGLIPQYILYSKLHMLNTFLIYIIPGAFSFYNMVVIRSYLQTIPSSLAESARLDGAGEVKILFRIILPLSMPILATITLWLAVHHWNDWTSTLYFVTKKNLYTLQYLLHQVIQESSRLQANNMQALMEGRDIGTASQQTTPEALKAAQIFVTTIPIICVYPWLQKYFMKGIMVGSIKE